ncbi:MAG: PH domain-containing protein [Candidatus Paceibacterota bacterium]
MLNLENDEKIILEVRKHWFVFLGNVIGFFVGGVLPIVFYFLIVTFSSFDILKIIYEYKSLYFFIYSLWLLLLWVLFFIQWTNYYLDVWYVTEKRIIDVNQKGIFHREISNLRFDKIQDISIEVRGFIATMLNYGDISVQTAAEDSSDFVMKNARDPQRIRRIVFSQHNIEAEKLRKVKIES